MAWGLASSSPCDTRFDFLGSCIGGFRISGGHCGWAKNLKFSVVGKSISKTNFEAKIFNFSPPAPRCTFDRSGARRVRIFCTSSLPCDAGFDFFGPERAKGSRKKQQELAADLESREGFKFFAHRPCPATQGSIFRLGAREGCSIRRPIWRPLDRMR